MGEIDLIKSRIKELIGFHEMRGALSSFEQDEVRELSMRFLGCGVPNCNCRNVFQDYLFLILNKLNKGDYKMKQSLYRLKKGVVIHVNGEAYTNANLTDDVAKAFIEKHPNNNRFESLNPVAEEAEKLSPIRDLGELQDLIKCDVDDKRKVSEIRQEYTGFTLKDGTKVTKEVVTALINRAKEGLKK